MAVRITTIKRNKSPENVRPQFIDAEGNAISQYNPTSYWTTDEQYYIHPSRSARDARALVDVDLPTRGYDVDDTTSYIGRVCKVETKNQRIMSDVWEDETLALVYSPETKGQKPYECGNVQETDYKWVHVHMTGNPFQYGTAEVDALPQVIQAWEDAQRFQAKKREAELIASNELENRNRIEKYKIVEVFKGRKVPIGTIGYVFWEGNTSWGRKLGIATTTRQEIPPGKRYPSYVDIVWVAESNVRVVGSENEYSMLVAKWAWEHNLNPKDCVDGITSEIRSKYWSIGNDQEMKQADKVDLFNKFLSQLYL